MFVLQVCATKSPGGIETAVRHYDRMFRALGVRSACLYLGAETAALRADGVHVIEAPRRITSPIGAVLPLFGTLRREILAKAHGQPDVVVVHSDRTLGVVRRMFPRARTVTPCHSDKAHNKRWADLVVTLNPDQQALVQEILKGSGAKAVLLGNPFVAEADAPGRPAGGNGPPRLVFCARFTPVKDPEALLRAVPLMRGGATPELLFIGSGPLDAQVRARAAASGLPCTFAGWAADPFAMIGPDDILVLPSSWEGLPYLLQEALAKGVGVIASDIAGNRQALGDGAYGLLYRQGDDAALAAAFDQALSDPQALKQKAARGRAALPKTYGADAFWSALSRELERLGPR